MSSVPRPASPLATQCKETIGREVAACSQGQGWASPARGADRLCPTQWEKSQLDEEFMHSTENVCGCAKYECGEWGDGAGVGEPRVGQPGWAGVGAGLPATVTTLHAPPVKAPVCVSRELGVMQPGQTVVELSADGVCHTSRCTDVLDPLTGFYQINATSVLCDVHCEAVGGGKGRRCGRSGGLQESEGASETPGPTELGAGSGGEGRRGAAGVQAGSGGD